MSDDFEPEVIIEDDTTYVTTEKCGNIPIIVDEVDRGEHGLPEEIELPEGFDPTDPAAWIEGMKSKDPSKRRMSMEVLKAMRFDPTAFIHWAKPERALVLATWASMGGEEEAKPKAKAKVKAKAKTATKTATKASAKKATSSATAAAAPAEVDLGPVLEAISELTGCVEALREEVAEAKAYAVEAHFLVNVLVRSDAMLSETATDMAEDTLGELLYPGNDEG